MMSGISDLPNTNAGNEGELAPKSYTSSDIHWRLIDATAKRDARLDKPVSDDGWVAAQALFCPYYANLEGTLGSDWGVIVNPESVKFGQLVFEHHWCGCPVYEHRLGDILARHGSGAQSVDEWRIPGCKEMHAFKDGGWESCLREKGHRGSHKGRGRSWRQGHSGSPRSVSLGENPQ